MKTEQILNFQDCDLEGHNEEIRPRVTIVHILKSFQKGLTSL